MSVAAPVFRRGKVRDMYAVGDDLLLMVASDRVSAFDVVMAEPIPGKGAVLTALSKFWFGKLGDVVPNHYVSDDPSDLPVGLREIGEALEGRWMLVRRAERIDIECVVRGYLAGSAWAEYRHNGQVAGEPLPAGMLEAQKLEQPIFTPAIKSESGHDENISRARMAGLVGSGLASELEQAEPEAVCGGRRARARTRVDRG